MIHTRIHAKYHMTYDTLLIGVLYLPVYNDTPIYAYVTVFNIFNIILYVTNSYSQKEYSDTAEPILISISQNVSIIPVCITEIRCYQPVLFNIF